MRTIDQVTQVVFSWSLDPQRDRDFRGWFKVRICVNNYRIVESIKNECLAKLPGSKNCPVNCSVVPVTGGIDRGVVACPMSNDVGIGLAGKK